MHRHEPFKYAASEMKQLDKAKMVGEKLRTKHIDTLEIVDVLNKDNIEIHRENNLLRHQVNKWVSQYYITCCSTDVNVMVGIRNNTYIVVLRERWRICRPN